MQNIKLLIVDDSSLILSRVSSMLAEEDCIEQIFTALSYAEAVKKLNAIKPDVIILDINLPDKSGIELLLYIKQHYIDTRVVMATNQDGEYYRALCLQSGADYFIDKSKDFEQLPQIISSLN